MNKAKASSTFFYFTEKSVYFIGKHIRKTSLSDPEQNLEVNCIFSSGMQGIDLF